MEDFVQKVLFVEEILVGELIKKSGAEVVVIVVLKQLLDLAHCVEVVAFEHLVGDQVHVFDQEELEEYQVKAVEGWIQLDHLQRGNERSYLLLISGHLAEDFEDVEEELVYQLRVARPLSLHLLENVFAVGGLFHLHSEQELLKEESVEHGFMLWVQMAVEVQMAQIVIHSERVIFIERRELLVVV